MKAPFMARKAHKWLALIIGVQATFWMISGAYMAIIDIDFIHGDSLVRNIGEPIDVRAANLYSVATVLQRYPLATRIDIVSRLGAPHYVVTAGEQQVLLDARTGTVESPLGRDVAISLASHYYAGDAPIAEINLLTEARDKPSEIQSRPLPLWQIRFDDAIATTFYLSPSTGALLSRRHSFWRLYDFLWMFHIMDYENRTDINNNLLRVAALAGLVFASSGLWLLFFSLKRRQATAGQQVTGERRIQ